jgi:hypothetical protein
MATKNPPTPKLPRDPNFSRGVNLSGLDPSAILREFNQVFIGNGAQKILLSKDGANSSALADVRRVAGQGILAQTGQTSKASAPKPGAGKWPAWATYAAIGAGVLILGGGAAFIVLKR